MPVALVACDIREKSGERATGFCKVIAFIWLLDWSLCAGMRERLA